MSRTFNEISEHKFSILFNLTKICEEILFVCQVGTYKYQILTQKFIYLRGSRISKNKCKNVEILFRDNSYNNFSYMPFLSVYKFCTYLFL